MPDNEKARFEKDTEAQGSETEGGGFETVSGMEPLPSSHGWVHGVSQYLLPLSQAHLHDTFSNQLHDILMDRLQSHSDVEPLLRSDKTP